MYIWAQDMGAHKRQTKLVVCRMLDYIWYKFSKVNSLLNLLYIITT